MIVRKPIITAMPPPMRTTSTSWVRSCKSLREPTLWPLKPSSPLWLQPNSLKLNIHACKFHKMLCLSLATIRWHTDQEQAPISSKTSCLLRWLSLTSKVCMNLFMHSVTTKSLIRGLTLSQTVPTRRRIWRWILTYLSQVSFQKCCEQTVTQNTFKWLLSKLVTG